MHDLEGKTALVTGGTSGIGRAVADALSSRGAHVVVVGRNRAAGTAVVEAVRARGRGDASFVQADLSDQAQVRRVAQQFCATHDRLDMLVHSAGGHFLERTSTVDGIEINFATNYLSKFLLTNLLHERLLAAPSARVVVVGSPVIDPKRWMTLNAVRGERSVHPLRAMLISGLATAVWTVEQARRFNGTGITINNVNPVLVRTQVTRGWPAPIRALDSLIQMAQGVSPAEGARAPVWLATANEIALVNGQFFRKMQPVTVPASTFDPALGARVWALSEQLTGYRVPSKPASART